MGPHKQCLWCDNSSQGNSEFCDFCHLQFKKWIELRQNELRPKLETYRKKTALFERYIAGDLPAPQGVYLQVPGLRVNTAKLARDHNVSLSVLRRHLANGHDVEQALALANAERPPQKVSPNPLSKFRK